MVLRWLHERRNQEDVGFIREKQVEFEITLESVLFTSLKGASPCVLQEKQSEMEGVKQQLGEVEKQRDEHDDTIGKLRQVTAVFSHKHPSMSELQSDVIKHQDHSF